MDKGKYGKKFNSGTHMSKQARKWGIQGKDFGVLDSLSLDDKKPASELKPVIAEDSEISQQTESEDKFHIEEALAGAIEHFRNENKKITYAKKTEKINNNKQKIEPAKPDTKKIETIPKFVKTESQENVAKKTKNVPKQYQENKKGGDFLTQKEFNQKYPDILRKNRFSKVDEKNDWIYITGYDEKTGQVEIGESGEKKKKVALKELDDFLIKYQYSGAEIKDTGAKTKRKFFKIEPAPVAVSDNKKEKKKNKDSAKTKEKNDSDDKKNETPKERDNYNENQGEKETKNEGEDDNKEKDEKNENAGNSEARGIENESKDKEDALKQEMETARKEYLEADYKTNSALGRIRKYFGVAMKNEKEKLPEIEGLKSAYEKKLFDLFEHKLQNAKYKGADEKELAKLFKEFKIVQRIELAEMHDLVKAEQVYGTNFGKIKEGLTKVVESYQKWPLKYKLAFGAICFGAGAMAGGIAAVGAALIVKRGFSGIVGAFGMKRMLDVGDRKLYERKIEKETQVMEENLKDKKGDEKYNDLLEKLKEMSSDDKLKNIKNWQRGKMTASIMTGIALGGGAQYLWGVTHEGGSEISSGGKAGTISKDISEGFDANNVRAGGPPDSFIQNAINEGKNPISTPMPENVPGASADPVPVGESGFWGAIHDKLDKLEPGGKHNGETAKIFNRAVAKYAEGHSMTVAEATEKLSHVNEGTNFSMTQDAKGVWQANFDDQNIKFQHHAPSHVSVSSPEMLTAEDAVAQQDIANGMKSYGNDIQSQIDNYEHTDYIDLQKDKIENARLWELLKEKSFLSDMVNPDTKEIVSETKNNIFGKSTKVFLSLKNENLSEIMKSEEAREAFLKKIPKSGRIFFNELVKQVPPKSGDTTLKWLVRVAVEIKKIKSV